MPGARDFQSEAAWTIVREAKVNEKIRMKMPRFLRWMPGRMANKRISVLGIAGGAVAFEINVVCAQGDFFLSGFGFCRARRFCFRGGARFCFWHEALLSVLNSILGGAQADPHVLMMTRVM